MRRSAILTHTLFQVAVGLNTLPILKADRKENHKVVLNHIVQCNTLEGSNCYDHAKLTLRHEHPCSTCKQYHQRDDRI